MRRERDKQRAPRLAPRRDLLRPSLRFRLLLFVPSLRSPPKTHGGVQGRGGKELGA